MNRAQKRAHAVVWFLLAPALIALVLWGILAQPNLVQPDPLPAEASP